jgi:hypothetical protein
VRSLVATLPGLPRISGGRIGSTIDSDEAGVDLDFSAAPASALSAIRLSTDGDDRSHAYRGMLPRGLTMNDRRRQIEEKLGPPGTSGGGAGFAPYSAVYPAAGVGIEYRGSGRLDVSDPRPGDAGAQDRRDDDRRRQ